MFTKYYKYKNTPANACKGNPQLFHEIFLDNHNYIMYIIILNIELLHIVISLMNVYNVHNEI